MEPTRGLYPWEQGHAAGTQAHSMAPVPAQQQPMQQQPQPGVFLPPHLRRTAVPQQQQQAALQQQQEPAGMSGLFGLLAAHRNQPQQQPAQPQQQLPTQPQQLPQHILPPHLLQQPQYAPPPQQQQHVGHMMPPPQQLSGSPPTAVQAAMQPLPASGNSSTPVASALATAAAAGPGAGVPAAAAPRSKGPPPGFKAPPPGFGNPGIASAAAMAAAPQQQQQAPLQQQQGSVAQADNRAAGSALLAALHNSSTSAQQGTLAVAAGGAVGTARAGRLPPHLQHMQAGAGAPQQPPAAAAAAQAPAGPSPAPPAAPQQQQAPTSTIPSASSSSSQPQSSQPPPQQQQQQQQQPLPRPSLQEWQARLREEMAASSDGGPTPCNLKEGLKWLAGFAPEAWDVLDEPFEKYFHYIRDTHGTNVLACVVFFSLGHHDVYRGATANLDLFSADFPAKVLNQRVSFYRLLFAHTPASKAAMMVSLIAHRPDVATWLSDVSMRQLFEDTTPGEAVEVVVAALLMLPEGWDRLLGPDSEVRQDPRTWLGRYVKAVQQEHDNAAKMSGFLWRKADAIRQSVAAARAKAAAVAAGGAAAAAAAAGSSGSSGGAAAAGRPSGGWGLVAAVARGNAAPAAAAGAGQGVSAGASPATPNLLEGALQQQLAGQAGGRQLAGSPARGGMATFAALAKGQQQQQQQQQGAGVQQQDPRSVSTGRVAGQQAAAAAGAVTQPRSQSAVQPVEAPAAAAVRQDVIQMAIVQLTKDRPDVVKYIPSDLQAHIRSLPGEIALEVLGALHDVPKGWDKGIKQPAKQLGGIARRAEAHARACASYTTASGTAAAAGGGSHSYGDAAEDDDGWVTAGKGANGGQSSSSNISSSNGHVGASSGSSSSSAVTVAGMISQLERQRPDVWQHLEERHFGVIKPLTQDKQKQVLALLLKVGPKTLANAQEPEAVLWALINNQVTMLTQPLPLKVQEGLQRLADAHPDVFVHMDDGVRGRICGMSTAKAIVAIKALEEAEYGPGWAMRCNNPSAWLMGIISRAVRGM